MRSDIEVWKFVSAALTAGERVVLLLVVESKGSSPGRPGFKMAVSVSGMVGSIGGEVMEVALVKRAQELLEKGLDAPVTPIRQVHRKNSPDGSGMICSGEQSVLIRVLKPEEETDVVAAAAAWELDEASLEITQESVVVRASAGSEGFERNEDGGFFYREHLGKMNSLFIVGGGHCSLALSRIMSNLDFRITVFDDRPNLNTLAKNDYAHRVEIVDDYKMIGKVIPSGNSNYVVVMTIGYKYDKLVVRELLLKDFKYFGVLGSKAKMAVLLNELRDEGYSAPRLERIHTPIGIDISSRTPAEIAVSIAAEIIREKNKSGVE